MKRTTLTFSSFFVFLLIAFTIEAHFWDIYPPSFQRIETSYLFEGDKHGDFFGDFVAVLSDGSEWKVHPDDRDQFCRWQIGQWVHVPVRKSNYWFKREHKFMLTNHDLGERVRVMLVRHAHTPVTIMQTNTYATGTMLVPIYEVDEDGNEYVAYYIEQACNFCKDLYMSDGTIWIITDNFNAFNPGQYVYVGVNSWREGFRFLLISGVEREAKWVWADPLPAH